MSDEDIHRGEPWDGIEAYVDEPLIDAARVEAILRDSLYTDEELAGDDALEVDGMPADARRVEGIIHTYVFNPRLAAHRDEVTKMLQSLPLEFRSTEVGGGGGWSFMNGCQDANNVQWTGLHRTMEMLFCLGMALELCEWLLPRDMWRTFPGGMPYVMVKV